MGGKIKEKVKKRKKLRIKTWILILLLVPLIFADVWLLRQNHIKMTELRDAVLQADADEDDEKLTTALTELKNYTFNNVVINVVEENGTQKVTFGTGPFYLAHQYYRAANKALEEAEKKMMGDNNPNGNVYGKAGEVCRALALKNHWTWDNTNFINCMLSEIQKYPSAAEIQDTIIAALPSTELYRHNYASPIWSPSLAGAALLVTALIIVVIFIRFLIWLVLRLSLLFV